MGAGSKAKANSRKEDNACLFSPAGHDIVARRRKKKMESPVEISKTPASQQP
jgi:hypothetical protein